MPAEYKAHLNYQDTQEARGFQGRHLQIPHAGETPLQGSIAPHVASNPLDRCTQPAIPTPPSYAATPYPRQAITDSKQRPNPHQQRPPTQQAAPWRAVPNRNHKPASNHEPAFMTSFGATITYHALKTTQTRLQPAVFRLYCNR